MSRVTTSATALLILTLVLTVAIASARATATATKAGVPANDPVEDSANNLSRSALTLAPSYYLYGDPATLEGRFEDASGAPDWQGWTSFDATEQEDFTQVSTFNAENLNGHGVGNRALWIGQTLEQQPSWVSPGYGNSWFVQMVWSSGPLSDPSAGQTVQLDGYLNVDLEPAEDWFFIDYETDAGWQRVYSKTWSNQDPNGSGIFPAPGIRISDVLESPITYQGGDYGGLAGDEIRIRLVVSTDGAWSPADGLWPVAAGAMQADDLMVGYVDGANGPVTDFTDFEGPGPYSWRFDASPFFGDFARLWPGLNELDPCAHNPSPQVGFMDDGRPPHNATATSTPWVGGTTSPQWNYGSSGGWVVPRTTAFTTGPYPPELSNEVWSPPIAFDLPGPADDGLDGVLLRFDHFAHLPLNQGIFRVWAVRSSSDGGTSWGAWRNENLLYYGGGAQGQYETAEFEVGDLLVADVTHVQVSLGVVASSFYCTANAWPCDDTTPAPWYDNVQLIKHPSTPQLSVFDRDLFQDTFTTNGAAHGIADLKSLACRFDSANDRATGPSIVAGDSMVVRAMPSAAADSLVRVEMRWVLDVNPYFASVRDLPPGVAVSAGAAANGWDQWSGVVVGNLVSQPQFGLYAFDFPYEGSGLHPSQFESGSTMFFPGDVMRFAVEAEDDLGRVAKLPEDASALQSGVGYDPRFEARALPSIHGDGVDRFLTPRVLLVDSAADFDATDLYVRSFAEAGLPTGVGYDHYRVRAAQVGLSNGIGAAGGSGATLAQLDVYDAIVVAAGRRADHVLSDGSGGPDNSDSDDLGRLEEWMALSGVRGRVFFGDQVTTAIELASASGQSFVAQSLGVSRISDDATAELGPQNSPLVEGAMSPLVTTAVARGSCASPSIDVAGPHLPLGTANSRQFEAILPTAAGVMVHHFRTNAVSPPVSAVAASVGHLRNPGNGAKTDLTFAMDLAALNDPRLKTVGTASARARILAEALDFVSNVATGGAVGGVPAIEAAMAARAVPNPFNPRTRIQFALAAPTAVELTIFDARGHLVRRIVTPLLSSGDQEVLWDGADDGGRSVASGVYHVRVQGEGYASTTKVALLR